MHGSGRSPYRKWNVFTARPVNSSVLLLRNNSTWICNHEQFEPLKRQHVIKRPTRNKHCIEIDRYSPLFGVCAAMTVLPN